MSREAGEHEGFPNVQDTQGVGNTFKIQAALFLAGVTGLSAALGFGFTLAAAKKQDPEHFEKGMLRALGSAEDGATLALRALGRGTLYACTGCGLLFYGIWKLSGAQNLQDFRQKAGSVLPKIPRNDPPQGRTEFTGLNDLLQYLSEQPKAKD